MRTLNGAQGSANELLDILNSKAIRDYKRENEKKVISEATKFTLRSKNEQQVFRKVYLKYVIMRVRSKISFMALRERKTITEFLIGGIKTTFLQLQAIGYFRKLSPIVHNGIHQLFENLIYGSVHSMMVQIIEMNKFLRMDEAILDQQQSINVVGKMDPLSKLLQLQQLCSKNREKDLFRNLMRNINLKDNATNFGLCFEEAEIAREIMQTNVNQKKFYLANLIVNLKLMKGEFFFKALLMKIQLSKELFRLRIQNGTEVLIPKDLSMDHLPLSFWYYDPILALVQDNLSSHRKQMALMKEMVAYNYFNQNDLGVQALKTLGIINERKAQLYFKPIPINLKESCGLDHTQSEHSRQLQRSPYLTIDAEINKMKTLNQVISTQGQGLDFNKDAVRVNLKFCSPKAVNQRRSKNLIVKSQFSGQINHLKSKG